jgi:hypothetical protein
MKTITLAGGLLASAVLLTGCGLQALAGPTNQDTVTYDVTDKVTGLRVDSGAGDVVVTEYDGSAVKVTETLNWRETRPETEHPVEGGILRLSYTCDDRMSWRSCHVNYKVQVPKGLTVRVDSGSGDVTLRSLSGRLDVSAGSGDVDGAGLAGKALVAEGGSGSIELTYDSPPDDVRLEAGAGDVTLRVPDGAYAVTTRTGSGDETISVKDDDASPRKMNIQVGSGDVSVLPR